MVLLESLSIPMGTPAIDFSLEGIDGNTYSLASFADKKALVIVFMCNHCPYVQPIWGRLVDLQKKYADQGVQFVGINANINPSYPEDSPEKMQEYAEEYAMNFPYLVDETQETARAYQAQCTPDIYVYDAKRELAYHGRVDNFYQDASKATEHDLDNALAAIVAGKKPSENQQPSMGCSIKWRD